MAIITGDWLLAGVSIAAAVGLAIPAAAEFEPLAGTYTETVIDDSSGEISPGMTRDLSFTPCGQGCTHADSLGVAYDLHLQGSTWRSGTYQGLGVQCQSTVDANSLVATHVCPASTIHGQLTRKAG